MKRHARNTLLLLAVGAVVYAMAIGWNPHALHSASDRTDPARPKASAETDADVKPNNNDLRLPTGDPAMPPHRTDQTELGSSENFRRWFDLQLAYGATPGELRRELESAIARRSAEHGADDGSDDTRAFDALVRAEQRPEMDYRTLMDQADQFLERFPHSPRVAEARGLFEKYSELCDRADIQQARKFSLDNPDQFAARIGQFERYLTRHAVSGRFAAEARAAIQMVRTEWSEHDYRAAYAFAQRYPGDLNSVAARLRRYLLDHPAGRHRGAAERFLDRFEAAASRGEYTLRVISASIDRSSARVLSKGPDVAVEVEVAGVRIGRTPIVADSFEPVWNYEFPQCVRWRMGDPIRIRLIDFDYGNRTIANIESSSDEPLAMRFLAGPIAAAGHRLVFETDFRVPTLAAP